MSLRLPDSGAPTDAFGRRHAPSAARNAAPILALLQQILPPAGRMLELASGTGQHARSFADALPGWHWQPTDVNTDTFGSITAWAEGQPRIAPARLLDAGQPGWAADLGQWDALLVVNLLHLIPEKAACAVLQGIATALAPGGRALVYGPFLRDGRATSEGDAAFHAALRAQNPAIGYKDLAWVQAQLATAGLQATPHDMPANNLGLVIFHL